MIKRVVGFFILMALWLVLTGGEREAIAFGVVVVLLALLIAAPLPGRIYPLGLLRFSLWFLLQSLKSGGDIALRALHPRLPLDPGTLFYDCSTLPAAGRRLFIAAISLIPGTLSVHYDGQSVRVHVLDRHQDNHGALDQLAARVAAIFRGDR